MVREEVEDGEGGCHGGWVGVGAVRQRRVVGNGGDGRNKRVFKGREGVLITRHGDNTAGIGSSGQAQAEGEGVSGHLWIHPRHHPPCQNHACHRPPARCQGIRHGRRRRQGGPFHSPHSRTLTLPAGPPSAQLPHRHLCHLHLPRRAEKVPQGPRGTRKGRRGL